MSFPEIIERLSYYSFRIHQKIYKLNNAILAGFWFGFMRDKSLDVADELYYRRTKQYVNEEYDMSGLFKW